MDICVQANRSAQIAGLLRERQIVFSLALAAIPAFILKKQGIGFSSNSSNRNKPMNWTNYHTLENINYFMLSLANQHPYICTVHKIGNTCQGRPIMILKISNGVKGNSGVWIDGAIHPREWISTAVATYIANHLVHNFGDLSKHITNKDWYILPVFNPDGYEYSQNIDRMWRKNRSPNNDSIGVDLNRNFSYGWGENGEEGSSDNPENLFYRGPEPFSENETTARFILESGTQFKAFISLHSYGEVVLFPWGFTSDPCEDYVDLLEGGICISKGILKTNGRMYKVGSTKDLMYYACGTSIDWSYGVAGIPYSYMIELRSKKFKFLLPKEEIIETASEVFNGINGLMEFIDKKSKNTQMVN